MSKPINLTKKAVGDGPLHIVADGVHITNGHWACKLSLLKQAALLTSVEAAQALFPRAEVKAMDTKHFHYAVPDFGEPITYVRTKWATTDGYNGDTVLFVGKEDSESQMWIARTYVDMFDLEEVTSNRCNPHGPKHTNFDPGIVGTPDDWSVIVMPVRSEYQEGLA